MSHTPSSYQQAVFNWMESGEGNAVIDAVAGSGKTTTIVKAVDLIDKRQSVAFFAFNRTIVNELKS
jgi:superfamily II DNA or RNA helicase